MDEQTEKTPAPRNLIVHLLHRPPGDALAALRALLHPTVRLSAAPDPIPADAEILVGGRPSPEELAACPALRAVIVPFAGVPETTLTLLRESHPHIGLHNLHHNAAAAAELALTLLLAAAKSIVPVDRAFRRGDWRSRYDGAPTLLLAGKTFLLIGLGEIARRVATACRALGMDVVAVRRNTDRQDPEWIEIHSVDRLPFLLPRADAICVAAALTPDTAGLLGARELALLPSHAVVVNIARGPIIDAQALYEALRDRTIGAAGIDTWYRYPVDEAGRASTPPSDFPFHELDNVVMSPHRGGAFGTIELEALRMEHLANLLNQAARGEPMSSPVDLADGY